MLTKSIRVFGAFLFCFAALVFAGCNISVDSPALSVAQPGEYVFCFWNVENFFDDHSDNRSFPADKKYDDWYSGNKEIMQLKLAKLTEGLLKINNGCGPDILAICEVECPHAAELLMAALNSKLDSKWHYHNVIMKDLNGGRHMAPAIITRFPVDQSKTRLHGSRLRILEGHVVAGGKELTIFAAHWTSRLDGGEDVRDKYADTIYKAYAEMYRKDPSAEILICGDFNDTPQDDSVVNHLHSTGDANEARRHRPAPMLYNLMASKDASSGFGTHYYNGKWFIFDQILVSPAMLSDVGWSCDPNSMTTFNGLHKPGDAKRRPWKFGGENEKGARGFSDHFPVIVKLRVK